MDATHDQSIQECKGRKVEIEHGFSAQGCQSRNTFTEYVNLVLVGVVVDHFGLGFASGRIMIKMDGHDGFVCCLFV